VILFISYGWETHIHQKSFKIYLYYKCYGNIYVTIKVGEGNPNLYFYNFLFQI
jgi:hypothetical protein